MSQFEQLKEDGIANGMCRKFQDEWKDPSLAELCRMFFRGMDFCIEHNWPSLDLAKRLFDANELAKYGIFLYDGDALSQSNVAALGEAEVHVYVPADHTCDIYARHNSIVHIHTGMNAFVYVTILDNARVQVDEKREGTSIKASYFGGTILNKDKFNAIHDKTKEE